MFLRKKIKNKHSLPNALFYIVIRYDSKTFTNGFFLTETLFLFDVSLFFFSLNLLIRKLYVCFGFDVKLNYFMHCATYAYVSKQN